jgi:hypothetical protein
MKPWETGCKPYECAIKATVTKPANAGKGGCPAGPFPVVYFFSGFSARSEYYTYAVNRYVQTPADQTTPPWRGGVGPHQAASIPPTTRRALEPTQLTRTSPTPTPPASLASYGYAVVQYNPNAFITVDVQEQKYLAPIRAALAEASGSKGGSLEGVFDFSQQAVVGHSRGGKLAALHLAAVSRQSLAPALCHPATPPSFGVFRPPSPHRNTNTNTNTIHAPPQKTHPARTPPPSPPPS